MTGAHEQHITAEAAELLCQPAIACLLKPFMRGERTVSQAAAELQMPLGLLHYRVGRFHRAGLLEVVRLQPRQGRASKVYRATGTSFQFSTGLLRDQTLHDLQRGQHWEETVRQQFLRYAVPTRVQAVTVQLDEKGALAWWLHPHDNQAEPAERVPGLVQVRSAALFLDADDAQSFADELFELQQRYQLKRGAKRYGLLLDLVPLDQPTDQPREP
ncbi:hypothetical protein ACFFLM_23565 [Deinococcus oregonensis]|uniref:ArsR family transcriptional regulator n=1 Tax=Deinococcus oregonensis TaxID=1805970 RepID=A0ABV6B598_9DEIO